MRRCISLAVAVVALLPQAGLAQEGQPADVGLPGSFWISAANVGPAEPGNTILQSGFEQGVTVWRSDAWFVVPYVGISFTADTAGYAWNGRHPATLGLKVVRHVPGGVVQVGAGVMFERDPESDADRHATAFAHYWSGWMGDRARHQGRSRLNYPGHAWVSSGILTGRDPENWITSGAVQQGVSVLRWQGVAAVPFAGAGGSFDTKRRPWENRVRYEGGVKAVRSIVGGVVEAGVALRREHRFVADADHTGAVGFVNLWIGWDPRPF